MTAAVAGHLSKGPVTVINQFATNEGIKPRHAIRSPHCSYLLLQNGRQEPKPEIVELRDKCMTTLKCMCCMCFFQLPFSQRSWMLFDPLCKLYKDRKGSNKLPPFASDLGNLNSTAVQTTTQREAADSVTRCACKCRRNLTGATSLGIPRPLVVYMATGEISYAKRPNGTLFVHTRFALRDLVRLLRSKNTSLP